MNLLPSLVSQPLFIASNKSTNTFFFHDLNKHAASGKAVLYLRISNNHDNLLGNFIYQNYRQALDRIQTSGERLSILGSKLGTTSEDYETYLKNERKYLQDLRVEPPEDVEKADYIDHLTKLYRLQ